MPTVGAVDTVVRLVEMFPPHLRAQTRSTLGRALRGIVSMRLLPRAGGRGRVPAVEVLVVNGLVAEALADSDGAARLERLMADGDYYGMQTFDQSLLKLYERGLVDRATVLAHATYAPSLQVDIERIERTRANGSSGGTMFPPTAGPPPLASVTSIAPNPPPASRQFPPPPPLTPTR
jgi:twitching motility protein PilT